MSSFCCVVGFGGRYYAHRISFQYYVQRNHHHFVNNRQINTVCITHVNNKKPRSVTVLNFAFFKEFFSSSVNAYPTSSATLLNLSKNLINRKESTNDVTCFEVVKRDTYPTSRLHKNNHQQEENLWLLSSFNSSFSTVNRKKQDDDKNKVFLAVTAAVPKIADNRSFLENDKKIKNSTTHGNNSPNDDKSNQDLINVYNTLSVDFPAFFTKSINYQIYHPEIEFVNNIKGTTYKGIFHYVRQMAMLRIYGHVKFAYVKMEVLKITMHPQYNTVRVRWRINGIGGMKVMFNFWRIKLWKMKESLKEVEVWYDGISTFYLDNNGLVFKHVADKMIPDDNLEESKPKSEIPSKLATELTFSAIK